MTTHYSSVPSVLRSALSGLIALAVAMGIGRFAFTPQLPVMQADLGLSLEAGGWLASANYLGYLFGALLAGRGFFSARHLMLFGLWTVVLSTAAMAWNAPLEWWLLMRFMAGFASAWGLVGTATLVLARLAASPERPLDGIMFAGVGAGIALTGLICLGGLVIGATASTLWLALGAVALAGTIVALWGTQSVVTPAVKTTSTTSQTPRGRIAKNMYGMIFCYSLFGFGYILPATYLPSQARVLLDDPLLFGWVWPLFGLAAAVSTLIGRFMVRWPRIYTWAAAQLVMATGLIVPVLSPGLSGLAIAAVCVGGTFMLITSLGFQEARERAGAHAQVYLAAMTAAFAAGQLAGPLAANALLMLGLNLDAGLWLGAAALLVSSVWLVAAQRTPRVSRSQ